jgi:hypothetical protein
MGSAAVKIAEEYNLSPLKAIRKHCVDGCCCGQANEVRLCSATKCALWPYRFGRGPAEKPTLTPLKAIRAKCLDCSAGSLASVRDCWDTECVLYFYREGKNPHLRGKRGKGNGEALRRWREKHRNLKNKETRCD